MLEIISKEQNIKTNISLWLYIKYNYVYYMNEFYIFLI